MSTEYILLQTLIGELVLRANQIARNPRACHQLADELQKALGLSTDEVIDLLKSEYGYVEKSAPTDPEPGPMKRLPLFAALRRISVEVIEFSKTTGIRLRCLRCGTQWDVTAFEGGDLNRPAGKTWMRCPAGCNMSAQFLWDKGKPPSYNP